MKRFDVSRWSVLFCGISTHSRRVCVFHPSRDAHQRDDANDVNETRAPVTPVDYSTSSFVAREQFHLHLVPLQCSGIFSNKVPPVLRDFTVHILLFSSQFFALCNLCVIFGENRLLKECYGNLIIIWSQSYLIEKHVYNQTDSTVYTYIVFYYFIWNNNLILFWACSTSIDYI